MFGIGYQEMFVILVVALVVFGPSRLPELAGQVGRWVRDFRRMSADLTGEFEKTFAEVDEVKKTFKRELEGIQEEVEGIGKSAKKDLRKTSSSGAKKSATASAKSGTAAKAASSRGAVAAVPAATADGAATASNGAASVGAASVGADGLARATKADPLVDVSFLDMDSIVIPAVTGAGVGANGSGGDDALDRVRRRRAAAAYSRRARVA
jgi:Tat protein translocase TatB subunit